MARNSEKAMTALARWRQMKIDSETGGSKFNGVRRRPYLAEECADVRYIYYIFNGIFYIFLPLGGVNDGVAKLFKKYLKKWRKFKTRDSASFDCGI